MSENLVIAGVTFNNVAGIKATDTSDNTVTYVNGYVASDFWDKTKPTGDIVFDGAYIGIQNDGSAPNYFSYRSEITKLYCPNYNNTANISYVFRSMTKLKYLILPKCTKLYTQSCAADSALLAVDGPIQSIGSLCFQNCSNLNMLVLRYTGTTPYLNSTNVFNGTKFASGGTGGTLYVPNDVLSYYQSASNWSTILGYTNNQIKSIESTHTDPNAPIDLTLYYADGTLIPTT